MFAQSGAKLSLQHVAGWARHCGFEPAPHHLLLIRKLEQVARGEIDRLAVFMPPGSAKSTYSSILFPPWFLAQKPGASIIAASHTTELAEKWGRRVRNLVTENGSPLKSRGGGKNAGACFNSGNRGLMTAERNKFWTL